MFLQTIYAMKKDLLFVLLIVLTSSIYAQELKKNRISFDVLTGVEFVTTNGLSAIGYALVDGGRRGYFFVKANYERSLSENKSIVINSHLRTGTYDVPSITLDNGAHHGDGLNLEFTVFDKKYKRRTEKNDFYFGWYGFASYLQDKTMDIIIENGVSSEIETMNLKGIYLGAGYAIGWQKQITDKLFVEFESGLGAGFTPTRGYYEEGVEHVTRDFRILFNEGGTNTHFSMITSFLNLNIGYAF